MKEPKIRAKPRWKFRPAVPKGEVADQPVQMNHEKASKDAKEYHGGQLYMDDEGLGVTREELPKEQLAPNGGLINEGIEIPAGARDVVRSTSDPFEWGDTEDPFEAKERLERIRRGEEPMTDKPVGDA